MSTMASGMVINRNDGTCVNQEPTPYTLRDRAKEINATLEMIIGMLSDIVGNEMGDAKIESNKAPSNIMEELELNLHDIEAKARYIQERTRIVHDSM